MSAQHGQVFGSSAASNFHGQKYPIAGKLNPIYNNQSGIPTIPKKTSKARKNKDLDNSAMSIDTKRKKSKVRKPSAEFKNIKSVE